MQKLFTSLILSLALITGVSAQTTRAFGDSITDGSGASSEAAKWRNIYGAALGVTVINHAHGGDKTGGLNSIVYGTSVGAGDVSLIGIGTNEYKTNGTDATLRGYYRDGLRNAIYWLALANKQTARSVGGETGSWSNTGIEGVGRASTSVGSTKTFTVSGTAVYVGMLIADTPGAAGTYQIRVDGALMGSYDSNAPGVSTVAPSTAYSYNNRLHRYAGLSSGSHTVEVKMTGPSNLYVQWAAGNAQTVFPKVLVGNTQRPADYSNGGSLAGLQAHNADWATVVAEAQADGLNVIGVDIFSVVNDTTHIHADKLHLTDAGNVPVANAYIAAAGGSPPPPPPPPPTVTYYQLYKGSDGIYYIDNSGTKTPTTVP